MWARWTDSGGRGIGVRRRAARRDDARPTRRRRHPLRQDRRRHRLPPLAGDARRHSLFWAGMNKGKRSLAVDVRSAEGQELVTALITEPGPDRGMFLSNFPAGGWLSDERLRARRADLIYTNIIGNPDGGTAVDYTVNPASGFAYATGPTWRQPADEPRPAGLGHRHRAHRGARAARRRAGSHPHRGRPVRRRGTRRRRVHDGRQSRLPRPGAGARRGPPADRQRHVRRVRPRLPDRRRPPGDGRSDQPAPVAVAGRRRRHRRAPPGDRAGVPAST